MPKQLSAKILKKLNTGSGMTILEMLVSMLIVVMVFVAVSTGVSVGQKAFFDSTKTSQSHILMESLIAAVEGDLQYATNVSTDANQIQFTNAEHNFLDATLMYEDGKLVVSTGSGSYDLVPEPTYTVEVSAFTAIQTGDTINMTILLPNGYSRDFAVSLVNYKETSE